MPTRSTVAPTRADSSPAQQLEALLEAFSPRQVVRLARVVAELQATLNAGRLGDAGGEGGA